MFKGFYKVKYEDVDAKELDDDDSHHILIPKNINGSKRKHND